MGAAHIRECPWPAAPLLAQGTFHTSLPCRHRANSSHASHVNTDPYPAPTPAPRTVLRLPPACTCWRAALSRPPPLPPAPRAPPPRRPRRGAPTAAAADAPDPPSSSNAITSSDSYPSCCEAAMCTHPGASAVCKRLLETQGGSSSCKPPACCAAPSRTRHGPANSTLSPLPRSPLAAKHLGPPPVPSPTPSPHTPLHTPATPPNVPHPPHSPHLRHCRPLHTPHHPTAAHRGERQQRQHRGERGRPAGPPAQRSRAPSRDRHPRTPGAPAAAHCSSHGSARQPGQTPPPATRFLTRCVRFRLPACIPAGHAAAAATRLLLPLLQARGSACAQPAGGSRGQQGSIEGCGRQDAKGKRAQDSKCWRHVEQTGLLRLPGGPIIPSAHQERQKASSSGRKHLIASTASSARSLGAHRPWAGSRQSSAGENCPCKRRQPKKLTSCATSRPCSDCCSKATLPEG